jgi:hypothetical protein
MEIVDIGLDDLEPVSFQLNTASTPFEEIGEGDNSTNFGPGIELLMNDKKLNDANNVNYELGDIDKLENSLKSIAGDDARSGGGILDGATKTISGFASNLFGMGGGSKKTVSMPTDDNGYEESGSKLGQSTASSLGNTKTWDGFTKITNIPSEKENRTAGMSDREISRLKRRMLEKLNELVAKNQYKINGHLSMESNFEEIEDEYETALEAKRKRDSVQMQAMWMKSALGTLEYWNGVLDPFDVNLDGWTDAVWDDIESYEDIFGQLYERYKGGSIAPELKLLLKLGISASTCHMMNKTIQRVPGMGDLFRDNPDLMRAYNDAAVKSMSKTNDGFAMYDMMRQEDMRGGGSGGGGGSRAAPSASFGPPPKPIETRESRPGSGLRNMQFTEPASSRPDLAMSRGPMFREEGIQLSSHAPVNQAPSRPEMKGPQNIEVNNIIAGLKPKVVDIHSNMTAPDIRVEDVDSIISNASLAEYSGISMPKKSAPRRKTPTSRTVALDL